MRCFNEQAPEYQRLEQASGISKFKLRAFVSSYYDKYGKFPQLDQIPGSNSQPFLQKELDIHGNEDFPITTIENISKLLSNDNERLSILEMQHRLNNQFRDQEITLLETGVDDQVVIKMKPRPTLYSNLAERQLDLESLTSDIEIEDSAGILINIVKQLSETYGIPVINITSEELDTKEWRQRGVTENAAGFIYDNTMYINTSVADVTAPLHELMHLIFGQLTVQDPDLLTQLLTQVDELPDYDNLAKDYQHLTHLDANEEILIDQYTHYVMHPNDTANIFNQMDSKMKDQILYNITRAMDSIFMGQASAASLENGVWADSLISVAEQLGSYITTPNYLGSVDLHDAAQTHRIAANMKSELLQSGKLIQNCE